ncbi:chemotaxis protein MotB [Tepidicaulis marinus]|uniref:Chemotaxis protein MotB n=1 Tax=Tepidicaulis marinus TaxID=1333998 RepID=A0A081B9L1_9HYPH|nr:hypothetical protein [Tepidicaulis marinus]GAK44729.1 chemotaxis protein MotB [Tepidicaulis marinus]
MSERSAHLVPARRNGIARGALGDLPLEVNDGSLSALWTLLSVFLLLLAMFAYLNSQASQDVAKGGPVIGSVQAAFKGTAGQSAPDASRAMVREALPGAPAYRPVSAAFAEDLRARLGAAGLGAGLSGDGGFLRLRLPAAAFFAEGVGALRPEQDGLLDTLAAMLVRRGETALRHRLRIVVPAAPEGRLDERRAMAFARALESRGASPGALIADVSALSGGDVLFEFFAEQPRGRGGRP